MATIINPLSNIEIVQVKCRISTADRVDAMVASFENDTELPPLGDDDYIIIDIDPAKTFEKISIKTDAARLKALLKTNKYRDDLFFIQKLKPRKTLGSASFWYGPDPQGKLFFGYSRDEEYENDPKALDIVLKKTCELAFKRADVKALVKFISDEDPEENIKLVEPAIIALENNGFQYCCDKPSFCGTCGNTRIYMRKKYRELSLSVPDGAPEPNRSSEILPVPGMKSVDSELFHWYFNPTKMMQ